MFVHTLNDAQQTALLALAQRFVHADARLAESERNLLELLAAEAGRNPADEIPEQTMDSLLAAFDTRQARAVAVLELIGVGHADDHFCPAESLALSEIAGGLGFNGQEVQAMESWVQRQLALAQEVAQFWEE
ncbi:MAG: hypothetical protein FJX77_09930 [Armatimonadetes bacterium]|nr:hypothetical protein [Armatimonadota bacterium]